MTESQTTLQAEALETLEKMPLDREIMSALQDPSHVGHAAAVRHRRHLYETAYGEGPDHSPKIGENTAADRQDIFQTPESPKDYHFDPVPDGAVHDAALEQKARNWFHEAGVPQWLARNIAREWNRSLESPPTQQQLEASAAATEEALRQRWGENYGTNITAARSLIDSLGDADIASLLDRSGLTNSEYLIRQLVALARSRSDAQGELSRSKPHRLNTASRVKRRGDI